MEYVTFYGCWVGPIAAQVDLSGWAINALLNEIACVVLVGDHNVAELNVQGYRRVFGDGRCNQNGEVGAVGRRDRVYNRGTFVDDNGKIRFRAFVGRARVGDDVGINGAAFIRGRGVVLEISRIGVHDNVGGRIVARTAGSKTEKEDDRNT
jgi:hypothetical protein